MQSSRGTFGGLLAAIALSATSALAQLSVGGFEGSRLAVQTSGVWSITLAQPAWTFSGRIDNTPFGLMATAGEDNLGQYQQISWDYPIGGANRNAGIRLYQNK